MRRFYIATEEEIKKGETTDVYFERTRKILEAKGLDKIKVIAEITSGKLPRNWEWGVLCGIEEEIKLLEGYPVNVYSMPEGVIFRPQSYNGVKIPVLYIEGPYGSFAHLETAILGLICQASGVATAAARVKLAANFKPVYAFGIRRMHPAIAPMLDRAAYIGGFDGVSGVLGAKLMGIKPVGTMPHALIILFKDQIKAWKAFDEIMPPEIPRIALVDTFYDEKIEAVMAAEALKEKLFAVRLDTPGSRRGDFAEIIREVRWELDLRGYNHVKIFVSGGLNEEKVKILSEAGADAFGVGTNVSNAPTIDFAMDIVEVEGKPIAKRGKMAGRKQVWRCNNCLIDIVLPINKPKPKCPKCNKEMTEMLKPVIINGKIVTKLPTATEIRNYVLNKLKIIAKTREQI